jgi:hypothetical protein
MDEIVRQAMAKWPNVPHCYGWLALDARGTWRMRDEKAQALGLPGDKIGHATLIGFINRNYTHDALGRWYFQNGPQRVYVDLETAPYIVRTDPAQGFILHTGEPMPVIDAVWLTESGHVILQHKDKLAWVDDRDLAYYIRQLRLDGEPVGDEQLMAWLSNREPMPERLTLCLAYQQLPVLRITLDAIAERFGFVRQPRPESPA